MKHFAILLAILATGLVSQTKAKPLTILHDYNNAVTATVEFLEAYKIAFGVEADQKFVSYQESKKMEVATTVEAVLKDVQEKSEESEKDNTHCMEKLKSKLGSAQHKAMSKMDKCARKKAPNWSMHNNDFDKLINMGKELHDQNEQIEKNCKSIWPWVTQRCISEKLPEVKDSVGLYKRDVAAFKELLSGFFHAAIDVVDKCLEEPLSNFANKVEEVRTNALECMEILWN